MFYTPQKCLIPWDLFHQRQFVASSYIALFVIQKEPSIQNYHVTCQRPDRRRRAVCHEALEYEHLKYEHSFGKWEFLWRCQRKWSSSCRVAGINQGLIAARSIPRLARRARSGSYGGEPDNHRQRGFWRITLNKHTLFAGQLGCRLEEVDQWWNGPNWLTSQENWPADILDEPTEESQAETNLFRKMLAVAVDKEAEVENVWRSFHLGKAVRVCAWMRRFVHNALRSRSRTYIEGPLTTQEKNQLRLHWERQAQKSGEVEKYRVTLNF